MSNFVILKDEVKKERRKWFGLKGTRKYDIVSYKETLWDVERDEQIKFHPLYDPCPDVSLSMNKNFQEIQKEKLRLVANKLIREVNKQYPKLGAFSTKARKLGGSDASYGEFYWFSTDIKSKLINETFLKYFKRPKTLGSITVEDSNFFGHPIKIFDAPSIISLKRL